MQMLSSCLDDLDYTKWVYYNLLELVDLYGRDKVLEAVHKMEDKYENINQK